MASLIWQNNRAYAVHSHIQNGKRVREWVPLGKFETKADGRQAFYDHVRFSDKSKNKLVVFDDLLSKYLEYCKTTKSELSWYYEKNHARALLKEFTGQRVDQITAKRIEEFKRKHQWSANTWRIRLTTLRQTLKYGDAHGFKTSDPFATVKIPQPRIHEMPPKAVPLDVVDKVIEHLPFPHKAVAIIQRYTGMRPCEVLRITKEDIAHNPKTLPARGKRQTRYIEINDQARSVLKYLPYKHIEPVYCHAVHDAAKRAGQARISPYVIRHSVATAMLERTGGDIRAVGEVLGHATIQMTTRYAHTSTQAKKRALDTL